MSTSNNGAAPANLPAGTPANSITRVAEERDELESEAPQPAPQVARQVAPHDALFDLTVVDDPTTPIFTKGMLYQIATKALVVRHRLHRPEESSAVDSLTGQGSNGKTYTIWVAKENTEDDDVFVQYTTRVEHTSAFQEAHGANWDRLKPLHRYNKDRPQVDTKYMPVPYWFETFRRVEPEDTLADNGRMDKWQDALTRTKNLWTKSSSLDKLRTTIIQSAVKTAPIKRIVCFGLGRLNANKKNGNKSFYQSAIQHMAVFAIANALYAHNKKTDPNAERVKVILQDPNYFEKDEFLLKWLQTNGDIDFVSEPRGLLAVDANTLVVTAFLPFDVPLLQILADLFMKSPDEGPAMILCDEMLSSTKRKQFSYRSRDAVHVSKWLASHYTQFNEDDGFRDHVLEPELWLDTYGNIPRNNKRYWLQRMEFFFREV